MDDYGDTEEEEEEEESSLLVRQSNKLRKGNREIPAKLLKIQEAAAKRVRAIAQALSLQRAESNGLEPSIVTCTEVIQAFLGFLLITHCLYQISIVLVLSSEPHNQLFNVPVLLLYPIYYIRHSVFLP
ncbi:hypothetical protein C5167_031068, partial [Papaver somniferum]